MHRGTSFLMISTVSLTGSAAESQSKHKLQQISRRFFFFLSRKKFNGCFAWGADFNGFSADKAALPGTTGAYSKFNNGPMPQHGLYSYTADPQPGTGSAHSAQETEHFRGMRAWVSLGRENLWLSTKIAAF